MRDPIPVWTAWARKMITFESVSSAECRRPLTQGEYVACMARTQRRAADSADMHAKTTALWRMENISAAFIRNARPGESLNDPQLPGEARAIAHCGIGIGAVEASRFQVQKLTDLIDSFSNPAYRMFAYDNIGAMLRVYEPGVFHAMARLFTMMGILPVMPLTRPQPRVFLQAFDPEARRLIAHGYGRMLYFTNHDIVDAIRAAVRSGCFEPAASVQGIAFAYSMVNNSDLRRVFQAGKELHGRKLGPSFRNGLVFALEFWEWVSPGLLERIDPGSAYGESLIAAAHSGVAAGHARGALAPFRVDDG